jgi:threonine dehydratase
MIDITDVRQAAERLQRANAATPFVESRTLSDIVRARRSS